MEKKQLLLRSLPSVDELLREEAILKLLSQSPRKLIVDAIRAVLDKERKEILEGKIQEVQKTNILNKVICEVKRKEKNHLRRVINATGVVVHTNLGRSLLAKDAIAHLVEVARYYNNLEYDLEKGRRGMRYSHVEELCVNWPGQRRLWW